MIVEVFRAIGAGQALATNLIAVAISHLESQLGYQRGS